ncbi:hypothetical protein Ddye_019070 [Dipteronia dyeriana]|uniref:S-protein homolog n=1 Tax=Dipteronia dyeriana TaxID=168575 RepID=A0AAD9WVN1_9ROSI|nr:hypothetical protein Ddye_019070 [Dipteronia dyeriana]
MLLILATATSISPVALSFEVFIVNILGTDTNLNVHCKSSFEDLGTHMYRNTKLISIGHSTLDIGKGSTIIYECDMSYEQRDTSRCGDQKCLWKVQQDGMYLYIKEHDAYEKRFPWS